MGEPLSISERALTKAQKRELGRLVGADQLTYGSARARVQNNLSDMGLAQFLDVDGILVCRITDLGHEAWRTGRVPPRPEDEAVAPSAGDLARHLRSLRAEREAIHFRMVQIDERVLEVTAQLGALERAGRA